MCGDYCKMCIKYASMIWTNQNSDWERSGPTWIMSSLRQPFVSGVIDSFSSEMRVLYLFSCNISQLLLSTGLKSREFGGHGWGGINFGVSFRSNSMVACAQSAFHVSQGTVQTLFRWGGKRLHHFAALYSGNGVPNLGILPEFYRRYYKTFWSVFFLHTV